jgi:D-glycero-alpha-D-manno-heptose-7-phosphate kinase
VTTSHPPLPGTSTEFAIRAPTRIDFGGGWTDVPPYDAEQGGFVCNVAIARYATVRIRPAPQATSIELSVSRPGDSALLEAAAAKFHLRGVRLSLTSDFPVAAGLGGSSAAGVASVAAIFRWLGESHTREQIAEASREIEIQELGIAGGRQDHYAAALGGALGITFGEEVSASRIPLGGSTALDLPRQCLVMYTGESRISGDTITAVLNAYRTGNPAVRGALRRMRELAEQMAKALRRGDLGELGGLVAEHWEYQRSLDAAIPTPRIDAMIDRAMKAGATGCKALGASGGGCVLIIAPLDRVTAVRQAAAAFGTPIDYTLDMSGVSQCA